MKKQYRFLALFLSVLLMLSALAACGAKSAASDTATTDTAQSTGSASMEENGMAMDMGTTESAPAAPEETTDSGETDGSTSVQPDLSEQKIIYSADVTVETLEFDKALDALDQMITELGGFAESANVSGNSRYGSDGAVQITDRAAYYTIRVPDDLQVSPPALLHSPSSHVAACGSSIVLCTKRSSSGVLSILQSHPHTVLDKHNRVVIFP